MRRADLAVSHWGIRPLGSDNDPFPEMSRIGAGGQATRSAWRQRYATCTDYTLCLQPFLRTSAAAPVA